MLSMQEADLVILDLMLPGLSGEEVIAEIRKNKDILILVISAKISLEDKVHALKLGADDYMTKPFERAEVLARVEALLNRKNSTNRKSSGMGMKMSRTILGISLLIVILGTVLTGCTSTKLSEDFVEDDVKAAAEEIVSLMNDNDLEAIYDKESSTLQEALTVDVLQDAVDQFLGDAGTFEKYDNEVVMGSRDKTTKEDYAVAVFVAVYEEKKITYTISFSKDMELIGFYMK